MTYQVLLLTIISICLTIKIMLDANKIADLKHWLSNAEYMMERYKSQVFPLDDENQKLKLEILRLKRENDKLITQIYKAIDTMQKDK